MYQNGYGNRSWTHGFHNGAQNVSSSKNGLKKQKDQLASAYDELIKANAAYTALMAQDYEAQSRSIEEQADRSRANAYAAARVSAIGNNEKMAARGLAGGLYQRAQSGESETSRVAQDIALRSNLTAIDLDQDDTLAQLNREVLSLRAQGRLQEAELLAQKAEALADLELQYRKLLGG